MTTAVLIKIEWKELPTKTEGKTSTGYELTFESGKVIKVFDVGLKNKPNVKKALTSLKKVKLPARVELGFIDENGFKTLNEIYTVEEQLPDVAVNDEVKTVKVKSTKTFVSDVDRQASIERQNALTNATNLVASIYAGIDIEKEFLIDNIKKIAKELNKFHQEV